jgi:hypothetical protein
MTEVARFEIGDGPLCLSSYDPSLRMVWGYRLIYPLHYLKPSFNLWVMRKPPKHPMELYIEGKKAELQAAREAYEAADQLTEKLAIEISALERAYWATKEATSPKPRRPKKEGQGSDAETKRGRSISEQWKKVLFHISQKPDGAATIDEIYSFCKREGIVLKRPTLRAQMSNYVNKHGYLASTMIRGRFEITKKGREMAETVQI